MSYFLSTYVVAAVFAPELKEIDLIGLN